MLPFLLASVARADWPSTVVWGGGFADAVTARTADVDGDGDLDVVSGSRSAGTLFWVPNDGAGGFGPLAPIDAGVARPRRVRLGDLDGDGDDDLVATTEGAAYVAGDEEVRRYENTGGAFGPALVVDTLAGDLGPTLADVDGDGDLDLLVAVPEDGEVRWYANDGAGALAAPVVVARAVGATDVAFADLDGDRVGDLAVAGWSFGGQTRWFPGLGGGAFGPARSLLNGYEKVVAAADLDDDGDQDVALGNDGLAGWKQNLGAGDFGDPNTYEAFTLTGVAALAPGDLDGDGAADLLWAEDPGRVWWLAELTSNPVAVGPTDAWDAWPADLDGDGRDDVLAASTTSDLTWTPNLGGGVFGPVRRVTTSANTVALATADLDGDGDDDVLTGTDGVSWFPVDGGVGAALPVTTDALEPERVAVADLDGDGVLDVLAAGYRTTLPVVRGAYWYRQGPRGFEPGIALEPRCDRSAVAADLDGDADLDVLCAGFYTLAWHKNVGGGVFSPSVRIDRFQTTRADALDVEGDGDLDVLAVHDAELSCATCPGGYRYVQVVTWYENDGVGGFGVGVDVSVTEGDVGTIAVAADLDGDGGDDVLVASPQGGVRWHANLGTGFGAATALLGVGPPATSAAATDLDGDGDLDVVASFQDPGGVVWYENDGRGGFGVPRAIDGAAADPGALAASDVDADGRVDVVALLAGVDALAWYAQPGPDDPPPPPDSGETPPGHTGLHGTRPTDDPGDVEPRPRQGGGCGCAAGRSGSRAGWLGPIVPFLVGSRRRAAGHRRR
jgi:hypothetical protein